MEAASIGPSLKAHGRARRRLIWNRLAQVVAAVAAFGAVAVLGIVVFNVIQRALPALNLDLFTGVQATFGESGGGIKHAIVGSVIIRAHAITSSPAKDEVTGIPVPSGPEKVSAVLQPLGQSGFEPGLEGRLGVGRRLED